MQILVQFGSKLGSQRVPTMGLAGLRETHSRAFGSTQQAKEWYPYLKRPSSTTLGRTPAYCDASRVSAGVQVEDLPQQGCVSPDAFRACPQSLQNGVNPSKILPKSIPNPSQIDPESIPKASWSSSWTNAVKKWHFERAKTAQESPKGAQETPWSVPKTSQMEPQTLPNRFGVWFLSNFFDYSGFAPICHQFFKIF